MQMVHCNLLFCSVFVFHQINRFLFARFQVGRGWSLPYFNFILLQNESYSNAYMRPSTVLCMGYCSRMTVKACWPFVSFEVRQTIYK